MTLTDFLAGYLVWTKVMLYMASVLIMISSIDDMFIDIYYWTRRIYREFTVYRRFGHLTVEQLREQAEKPLAIMIPAWQEAPVIAKMIENAISTFEYSNYLIFAGTYPNDPETGREVELVRERFTNVERVVTPHDGPTSKADCLNWVIQAIKLYEQENGIEFAGIVMHDAEDVVHPLEMRLFNHLIGRFDFIQLPVYPLESRWWRMTSGHSWMSLPKTTARIWWCAKTCAAAFLVPAWRLVSVPTRSIPWRRPATIWCSTPTA